MSTEFGARCVYRESVLAVVWGLGKRAVWGLCCVGASRFLRFVGEGGCNLGCGILRLPGGCRRVSPHLHRDAPGGRGWLQRQVFCHTVCHNMAGTPREKRWLTGRQRPNLAHVRQLWPDPGLGQVLNLLYCFLFADLDAPGGRGRLQRQVCCEPNLAHISRSRPDYNLGYVLKSCGAVPSSLRSELGRALQGRLDPKNGSNVR